MLFTTAAKGSGGNTHNLCAASSKPSVMAQRFRGNSFHSSRSDLCFLQFIVTKMELLHLIKSRALCACIGGAV